MTFFHSGTFKAVVDSEVRLPSNTLGVKPQRL